VEDFDIAWCFRVSLTALRYTVLRELTRDIITIPK
jgi:hypothetical protein